MAMVSKVATNVSSQSQQIPSPSDRLIWLDACVDKRASQSRVKQLREIDPHLVLFSSPDQCLNYILEENDKRLNSLIIITSGTFGRDFIPVAHDCPCVVAFFIYCRDTASYSDLQFDKLERICDDVLDLLHAVNFFILRTNEKMNINFFQADQSSGAGMEWFPLSLTGSLQLTRIRYTERF